VFSFEGDEGAGINALLDVELGFEVVLGLRVAVEVGDAVFMIAANKTLGVLDIFLVLVDLLLVFDHVDITGDVVVAALLGDVEHEVFRLDGIML
jgi:hypothetical protein